MYVLMVVMLRNGVTQIYLEAKSIRLANGLDKGYDTGRRSDVVKR